MNIQVGILAFSFFYNSCLHKVVIHIKSMNYYHQNYIQHKVVTDCCLQFKQLYVLVYADVESVMNSVVSLLLILEPDKQEALIENLCEKLVKFREGERPSLRLQL